MPAAAHELVANVLSLPADAKLGADDADRILEIAYLTIASDGQLTPEEIFAFRQASFRLRVLVDPDATVTDAGVDELFRRFGASQSRDEVDARLDQLGSELGSGNARALAYKLSYALSLCDLSTSDSEFEFDLQLIDALSLSNDEAERFVDEVMSVIHTVD